MHPFEHANAFSMEDAVEVLDEACRPLAGGTDLIAMMKEGLVAPERLVNLKTISGGDAIDETEDAWQIGALATLSALADHEALRDQSAMTALVQAADVSASPQIRHMGTLGGNLVQRPRCWYFRNRHVPCWRKGGKRCFAFRGENKYHTILGRGPCYAVHPSDPAVALLALDASVVLMGPEGQRTLALADFYRQPMPDVQRANGYHPVTVLASNELVTEIVIPKPDSGTRSVYVKKMERGDWDFALVSVAVRLLMSGDTVEDAAIAMGGVATIPWRHDDAAQALVGRSLSEAAFDVVADAAVADVRPLEHNGYKVDLLKGAIKQALRMFE
jgi:xanthine dehydrogenase YagS FAD-binding subunit